MIKSNIKIALLLAIVFAPLVSFASIDVNLKYGARGQEVSELQEFLISKGFLIGQATGNFYSLTQKAVIAYQTSINLPSTGYVGPMTREKINADIEKDVAVTTEAEIQETGTTNTPLNTTANLQRQLDDLITKMETLVSQQKTSSDQTLQVVTQIAQNTTPVQNFGSVEQVAPVDKSALTVSTYFDSNKKGNGVSPDDTSKPDVFPYGRYIFTVTVYDKDGKTNGTTVDPLNHNVLTKIVNVTQTSEGDLFGDNNDTRMVDAFGKMNFDYAPSSIGTKVITFTSGDLTTSTTIEVK